MNKIEYEIKLNDSGRPCIELPVDYEHNPEDRFFAIELARYILQDVFNRRKEKFPEDTSEKIESCITILGQVGDEVAHILYDVMRAQGTMKMMLDVPYHIQVNSYEELELLPNKNIIYGESIFDRAEGLRVYVLQPLEVYDKEISGLYELVDGITNEHWKKRDKKSNT
jgi:hypothetical protein